MNFMENGSGKMDTGHVCGTSTTVVHTPTSPAVQRPFGQADVANNSLLSIPNSQFTRSLPDSDPKVTSPLYKLMNSVSDAAYAL